MSRYFTTMLGCAAATILLCGCVSIGARMVGAVLSDPRTKNHAYYAKVELSFTLGEYKIAATRYAEAWYLTGGSPTNYHWPPCDETKPSCWGMTDHYFVGLPNGDIADLFVDRLGLPLANLNVGQPVNVVGRLALVYRDQPDSPHAKEFGPCLPLSDEYLKKDYNLSPSRGTEPRIAVTAVITRRQGTSPNESIFPPDKFYEPKAFDGVTCRRLIKRITGQTIIGPR